jgi:small subunit ribosomal protein S4e
MKHLKRQKIPKSWPIPRKGTTYVVRPSFALNKGVPLLILLRDMLKIAKNRKEVKKAIYEKNILVNAKPARDEKNSVQLFDKISLVPSKTHYKVGLSKNGRFAVEEIEEKDVNQKIAKIIDKKVLKGKKIQINLSDGRNFISDIKCNVGDSVSINFKDKKIDKCWPLKESAKVIVFAGKHAGKRGKILKLKPERKMASLDVGKEKINVLIKQMMVTE